MTPKELKEIVKEMKKLGVLHLKTPEFDLTLDATQIYRESPKKKKKEEDKDIKHKVEELTSLMKLSDNELINRLFPDEIQEEASL